MTVTGDDLIVQADSAARVNGPLLEARGIVKVFSGTVALQNVDLVVARGEIVGLVGANGAGKSTLAKIIAGVYRPDEGTLFLNGQRLEQLSPLTATRRGIVCLYQRVGLVDTLTPEENLALFLGYQQGLGLRAGLKRARSMLKRAPGTADLVGRPVEGLNPHQKQLIQALKARILDCRVLIADETSVALNRNELIDLFAQLRSMRADGTGVIYISHVLEEVVEIADRIVVIRDGRNVGELPAAGANKQTLARMIVGTDVVDASQGEDVAAPNRIVLRAADLRLGTQLRGVSLQLRAGEILGVTGLEGSGRRELTRLLGGMIGPDTGRLELDGKVVRSLSPKRARRLGIMYVTGDRSSEGLMMSQRASSNFGLAHELRFWRWLTSRRHERTVTMHAMGRFSIVPPQPDMSVDQFSGGNQQRILLAMALDTRVDKSARIVILDDPTVGVDVGARQAIHQLIRQIAKNGTGVVVSTFDVPEMMAICHRILVLKEGVVNREIDPSVISGSDILEATTE